MVRIGIGALAALSVLALSGCSSGQQAATRSTRATTQPNERGTLDPAVPSRDGNRIAVVRHLGSGAGSVEVGRAGGGPRRTVFNSNNLCCEKLAWAARYLLVFEQNFMIKAIDIRTRRIRVLASADDFNISSGGRWIAWETPIPGGSEPTPNPFGVVSTTTGKCLILHTPKNELDFLPFFHPGNERRIYFLREIANASGQFVDGSGQMTSLPLSRLRRAPKCSCFAYAPGECPY